MLVLKNQPKSKVRTQVLIAICGLHLSPLQWLLRADPLDPPALPAQLSQGMAANANDEAISDQRFYIRHYRVIGAKQLPPINIEKAVYPFMGPNCTAAQVEKAATELQKAYHEAGYKTVTVEIPEQDPSKGIVSLKVVEGKIGRLRIRGARFFSPEILKSKLPSLAEGTVPDFNQVTKEVVALNKQDIEILPEVHPGAEPGTFDVEMRVKDKAPFHGNLELNNRYSPDTTELRVNAGVSFTNLWQAGHVLGASMQLAPERLEDAQVFSGYYLWPVNQNTSLMLTGTKQDSNLNTLGGVGVAGRGYMLGAKLNWTLPQTSIWQRNTEGVMEWKSDGFIHSLGFGLDYKHFDEDVSVGATTKSTPIEYYPLTLSYNATWLPDPKTSRPKTTELNLAATFHTRGLGSDVREFDSKRYKATGAFFTLRGDLSQTRELAGGWEAYAKLQGQWSGTPLINSEQYAGGGLNNARGYLESTSLGDQALFGTLELRTPSLIGRKKTESEDASQKRNEWRFHAFCDAGYMRILDSLPDQEEENTLVSVGLGSRFQLGGYYSGSIDAGFPLSDAGRVEAGDVLVTFKLGAEF